MEEVEWQLTYRLKREAKGLRSFLFDSPFLSNFSWRLESHDSGHGFNKVTRLAF